MGQILAGCAVENDLSNDGEEEKQTDVVFCVAVMSRAET